MRTITPSADGGLREEYEGSGGEGTDHNTPVSGPPGAHLPGTLRNAKALHRC
ncbi:hypothetical protein AB0O50_23645 [Streptomyces cyaneofuscatus]|uniref:hypothetical protein n=1 Tax=Streptomyces cyaneofuscatus TaxID=66883 RepID=UPI003446FD71